MKLYVLGNCDIFFGPKRVNRIYGSFQQSLSSHTEMLQRPTTVAENTWPACLPTRGTLQISPWLAAFPDDPFTRMSWGSTTINNTERREGCNRCIICIPILGRYAQSTCIHAHIHVCTHTCNIPHDFGVMKKQAPSQCRNETDVVIQEMPPREYSLYFYCHSTCIRRKHHYLDPAYDSAWAPSSWQEWQLAHLPELSLVLAFLAKLVIK